MPNTHSRPRSRGRYDWLTRQLSRRFIFLRSCSAVFMSACRSIPRVRIGREEQLDIFYTRAVIRARAGSEFTASNELLNAFVRVSQQGAARDDQQPLGIPNGPSDQARVGDHLAH